jgi:isoleucyl-tRNA synthetase
LFLDDASGVLVSKSSLTLKHWDPVWKRYGFDLKRYRFSADNINQLESNGTIEVVLQENITLTMEDVEISSQDIEGWLVANSNGITVALDIVISQIEKRRNCEGISQQNSKYQKGFGFEVTDKIKVYLQKNDTLEEAVKNVLY